MRSLLGVLNIFGSLLTWFALYFLLPIVTALFYGEIGSLARLSDRRPRSASAAVCCCVWRRIATSTT